MLFLLYFGKDLSIFEEHKKEVKRQTSLRGKTFFRKKLVVFVFFAKNPFFDIFSLVFKASNVKQGKKLHTK